MLAYQLKIEMKELPTVWRRVIVPCRISFEMLHYVIQYVMGWQSYHLYEFSSSDDPTCYTNDLEGIDQYEYLRENPDRVRDRWDEQTLAHPAVLASSVQMDPILIRAKTLDYLYDFGDHWEVTVTLEEMLEDYPNSFAVCTGGKEPAPPEDVGGTGGYMDFLEAWHNPAHEEHAHMVAWGESQGFTGRFDRERVNQFLQYKLPLGTRDLEQLAEECNRSLLPFTEAIAFNPALRPDKAKEVHLVQYMLGFLQIIDERGPLKATAKGNLPAKLVMELFAQGYDYLYAPFRARSVRKEDDAWFLGELHALGRSAGLIKKHKGEISLTKKGRKVLQASPAETYLRLLRDYVFTYNMGFRKDYEVLPSWLINYLIGLLARYGSVERESKFYSEKLVRIYPLLLKDHESEREQETFDYAIFRWVMEQFLAEFGLVETRRVRDEGRWGGKQFVRKTEFFDQVLITW
jgi:hypothetical protein